MGLTGQSPVVRLTLFSTFVISRKIPPISFKIFSLPARIPVHYLGEGRQFVQESIQAVSNINARRQIMFEWVRIRRIHLVTLGTAIISLALCGCRHKEAAPTYEYTPDPRAMQTLNN